MHRLVGNYEADGAVVAGEAPNAAPSSLRFVTVDAALAQGVGFRLTDIKGHVDVGQPFALLRVTAEASYLMLVTPDAGHIDLATVGETQRLGGSPHLFWDGIEFPPRAFAHPCNLVLAYDPSITQLIVHLDDEMLATAVDSSASGLAQYIQGNVAVALNRDPKAIARGAWRIGNLGD